MDVSRDKVESIISEHGGRITTAVSGKTDYLVTGYKMEDGREITQGGKYRKATTVGTCIVNEEQFEQLIRQRSGNADFVLAVARPELAVVVEEPASQKDVKVNSSDMWTERYKPKAVSSLIGNKGVVDSLYAWLKDWDDVVLKGNKKNVPFRKGMSWADAPNVNARAVLLSGPPGIGKTTSARLVCQLMGYEVVEQNASDTRNKSSIECGINVLS